MNPSLPPRRIVALPAVSDRETPPTSGRGGTSGAGATPEGTRERTTSEPREYGDTELRGTRFTDAEVPRQEACFLCKFVSHPAVDSDPLAEPEANVILRIRKYWDANVNRMDFRCLAEDCASIFAKEYAEHWALPGGGNGDTSAMSGAPLGSIGEPDKDCAADADMIYRHFTLHEGTPQTRRAVLKRAYVQQFEFLEQNKRNAFVAGKHGKRVPDRVAEAAHSKGCLVLLKMGAYLDKIDEERLRG